MASITSWTRLETDTHDPEMRTVGARIFDPLWMLARQWQVAEFQAEDAGSPVVARARGTNALLQRCHLGALPPNTMTRAPAYDPLALPLEMMVERRRMRPADPGDTRMIRFAIEAGLYFLEMLKKQPLAKDYRARFVARFVLQPVPPPPPNAVDARDAATERYLSTMIGRAVDGRRLESEIKARGAEALSKEAALEIASGDRSEVKETLDRWLAWYSTVFAEPTDAAADAWIPSRLEYGVSVSARLSADPFDERTLTAVEYDGGVIDWSSFDVNLEVNTGTTPEKFSPIVETTIPAPVTFRGAPAARFWEFEDARIEYGLLQVGPTDLAQLLMIEYASSYGNDWFIVPLSTPVGSLTAIQSLVVTDTFGVKSLLRPIGDRALPKANWSMWQHAFTRTPGGDALPGVNTNMFFLPPSLARTVEGRAVEEVLFMRDEMANMAWAIERRIESGLEQPVPRPESASVAASMGGPGPNPGGGPGGAPGVPGTPPGGGTGPAPGTSSAPSADAPPRYLLSTTVPAHWIPLLPVQVTTAPGKIESRLRRGAVLQPDGSQRVHRAQGEMLNSARDLLLYDEELPREGLRLERRRQMTRWVDGSTWLWTAYRKYIGRGEGSSGLTFDRIERE